jgi:serine/threonine protein kinase
MMERLKPEDDPPASPIPSPVGMGRRAIPDRLDDFRILRFVAEGDMGYVFEAEQESMGRHVALKVLKPEIHSPKTDHESGTGPARKSGRRG